MRILHLPGKAIMDYSEDDMRDLLNYFKPDLSVTTGMKELQKRKLEQISRYEALHLDSIQSFTARKLGNEALLLINDGSSLDSKDIDLSKLKNKKVTVITDQIREDINPKNFQFELLNTFIIDRLKKEMKDFQILSTEIEAGKKPKPEEKETPIYGFGVSESIGGTKIPNVITSWKRPHVETLDVQKVGLSAVPGMGKRFTTELENRGITSRKELCSIEPSKILEYDGIGPYRSTKWVCSAKAIEEQRVFKIRENDLAKKHRLFIDIETDSLNPRIIWHIGLYDDKKNNKKYRSFVEKEPDKKGRIIRRFVDHLEKDLEENSVLLAWYGKKFDFLHLTEFIEDHHPKRKGIWDEIDKIDFMYWVDKHAALPSRSSKLENVANRLGYEPELRGLDGEDVARRYTEYMNNREKEPDWDELMTYAKDDVVSMKYIYDEIKNAPMLHDIKDIEREYRKTC